MMRLIFILCFTLQCGSLSLEIIPTDSMNDEIEKYVELNMDEGENSGSVEELGLTTLIYETKTDANPPTSTPSILQEFSKDSFANSFEKEITESPYAFMAEPSETVQDFPELSIKRNKPIKGRLLDSKSSEILIGSEHLNESVEIVLEDTTVIATNADSDGNETIFYNEDDDATTVQPTTPKKPKNLEIYKTRPNVLLRHYVEDSRLRSPIAALIDKKANPLIKSKKLWKSALRPNSLLDIMVVSYDSEGIKSTYNLTNTKTMIATLDRVKEENITTQESNTYYSIIRTGQLIPYDSAIFVSTDRLPNNTQHQQPASMILLKKRIRLYLIIFDEKNHVLNETSTTVVRQTGFLGQLALRTGGDIIYVPNHAFRSDGEMELITLIVANRLKPIDSELREVQENELKNENIDLALENGRLTSE